MAGLGGKNWTFQEEVTSSDVNGYLADQVVMRFADSTARTAGFGGVGEPVLAEGMISYLDNANRVDYYDGSAWKPISAILQVVQTAKTDTFTTTNTTYTEITGLTASITPSTTSSKVLVMVSIDAGSSTDVLLAFRLMRSSTAIGVADTAGNRTPATFGRYLGTATTGGNTHIGVSTTFLDSPSTTSSTTYSVQVFQNAAGTIYVNRGGTDNDLAGSYRAISTITLMEVAG